MQNNNESYWRSNIPLISSGKLLRDSYLDDNVDHNALRIATIYVQDSIIERILGTCLFKYIKQIICDGTINDPINSFYLELVNDYLSKIFIYLVPAEIHMPLSYKTRNAGLVQVSDDSIEVANTPTIHEVNNSYRKKADLYIKRAVDFLKCHYGCITCCDCGSVPALNKDYHFGFSSKPTRKAKGYCNSNYRISRYDKKI